MDDGGDRAQAGGERPDVSSGDEDRQLPTLDSEVDAFLAAIGNEGDGSAGSKNADRALSGPDGDGARGGGDGGGGEGEDGGGGGDKEALRAAEDEREHETGGEGEGQREQEMSDGGGDEGRPSCEGQREAEEVRNDDDADGDDMTSGPGSTRHSDGAEDGTQSQTGVGAERDVTDDSNRCEEAPQAGFSSAAEGSAFTAVTSVTAVTVPPQEEENDSREDTHTHLQNNAQVHSHHRQSGVGDDEEEEEEEGADSGILGDESGGGKRTEAVAGGDGEGSATSTAADGVGVVVGVDSGGEVSAVSGGDASSREVSLLAQGVVTDVLDTVLAENKDMVKDTAEVKGTEVQAETGENDDDLVSEDTGDVLSGGSLSGGDLSGDDLSGPALAATTLFPELEKVDLASQDWDPDLRESASDGDKIGRPSADPTVSDLETGRPADPPTPDSDPQQRESGERSNVEESPPGRSAGEGASPAGPSGPTRLRWPPELVLVSSPRSVHPLNCHNNNRNGGSSARADYPLTYGQPSSQRADHPLTYGNASPTRADYPLNYNNYTVCRMLSPDLKECLILETGEQVIYDCGQCGRTLDPPPHVLSTARPGAPPTTTTTTTPSQAEKDRVKRDLFPDADRAAGPPDTSSSPPGAPSSRRVAPPASADRVTPLASADRVAPLASADSRPSSLPSLLQSRPTGHSSESRSRLTGHTSQGQPRPPASESHSRLTGHASDSRGPLDESHDGSYLWLQQQVQWRAGNSGVPAATGQSARPGSTRDTSRLGQGDRHSQGYGDSSRVSREIGLRESTTSGRGESRVSGTESRDRRPDTSGSGLYAGDRRPDGGLSGSMSGSGSASRSALDTSGSVSSPGAIPNFKTLQDQQVSWLSMYRMLEDSHRGELQVQQAQHSRLVSDMQRHLEGQLIIQQQSVTQRLHQHRQALRESSGDTGRGYSVGHLRAPEGGGSDDARHLPNTSSFTQGEGGGGGRPATTTQRSPPSDRSRSRTEVGGGERRLRGGVYSSPMPLGKHHISRDLSGGEGEREREGVDRTRWSSADLTDPSLSDDHVLSPRTRSTLRDKHSRHMTDLRQYYEAELTDLRHKLSAVATTTNPSSSSGARESGRERILADENQSLRQQLRDVTDALDDSQILNREIEQKLQGLEIRAADYADRYEDSQHNVLKLKNRLEELHSYAKDRDSVLQGVTASERRQNATLAEMFKAQEDQVETSRREKAALKRLLDKYEMLEKDYNALKDTSTEFEKKLFETRTGSVELNKTISQLELDNKRLTQENSNMRHRLAISGSLPMSKMAGTEEALQRGCYGDRLAHSTGSIPGRTAMRGDRTPPRRALSDDEDEGRVDNSDSPLLRAERELKRLQETMGRGDFVPRLQPKRYAPNDLDLGPVNGETLVIDALTSPTRTSGVKDTGRRKDKKVAASPTHRGGGGGGGGGGGVKAPPPPSSLASPTRFDVGVTQTGSRSQGTAHKGRVTNNAKSPPAKSGVDGTLDRIRSGDIVSRPQWEDVYTSLAAKPRHDNNKTLNMTQEEMLRSRIQTIEQIERHYDDLHVQKRKLESQLNKIPTHGRDRKTRREKELVEEKLDSVDHELGSVRMTLKRYQVLKSSM